MGTIYDDIATAADAIAAELTGHGYGLDFTPDSLAEIDRFLDENSTPETAETGSLLSDRLGQWLFALGAYSGEVVAARRGWAVALGGRRRRQGGLDRHRAGAARRLDHLAAAARLEAADERATTTASRRGAAR